MLDHLRRIWIPLVLFVAAGVGYAALVLWTAERLPDQVVTNFGSDGSAGPQASKSELISTSLGVAGLIPLIFLGVGIFLPKFSDDGFNLPHREYWLHPQRRAKTMADFCGGFLLLGVVVLVFMAYTHGLIYRTNLSDPPGSVVLKWELPLLLAVIAGYLFWLFARYSKIPDENFFE